VCDGYDSTTGRYHLNYGGGNNNPTPPWWYSLPSGMPLDYSIVYNGVLDIKPPDPGGDNYCRDYGPCSAGQGDCDSNAECQSGLTCVNDVGAKYGWKSVTDVCEESTGGNLMAYVKNWNGTRLLSGATVTVGGKSATTGSGGYVTITGIAAGTNVVTISYGGGHGYGSIDIVANTTVTYTWRLGWVY